ncbi:MAG: hypothetical protein ISS87_00620 [Candidatus Pacebacteria bacterium]|nr:hypothetical protein [Candidatus Paceibacterota bacterium]
MSSTQSFLEIDQIREGIIILKNKGLRGVLMVSSLNFALKSEEEQNAILYQFQNFLNTLDFSLQIVVQSRRLNITGYIDQLKEIEKKQENDLMKLQTTEYRKFIEELISQGVIMSKKFFIIVPFTIWETKGEKPKISFLGKGKTENMTEQDFQRCKIQLWQRMEFIALGLRRSGLQVVPLNTSEIIELFWSLHHPREAEVGYYPEIPPELIK